MLFLGSVVHATGSSLACPDWPTCFGTMFPEMTGGVFWEHLHPSIWLMGQLRTAYPRVKCCSIRSDVLDATVLSCARVTQKNQHSGIKSYDSTPISYCTILAIVKATFVVWMPRRESSVPLHFGALDIVSTSFTTGV
mgnify:CR=1 FL=1